ncbi:gamma-type small acid-soluble spore protein [Ureibacillus chungkukjangi]|uniref:Gamma-type small acid-soluble spore protein n=1 Tax=Ureibacillus chungkukjangi TaxID=1202712 RepID=A0A318TMZ5_9BACL|nr:gamma-type small acid-soluble spore protein [Ureibacillus chungkukjangi]MCM3388547.1 gamma-type small acid-soluble spore protein [Ureibacillus chungkukjangi]PYF05863.1 hypothetical protein BJ095_11442 [Ureibacillus chungkukjangi]
MQSEQNQYTVSGTDIEEVKRKNAASGMSYKEVMEYLASTGGKNTKMFSDTNIDEVKKQTQHPH